MRPIPSTPVRAAAATQHVWHVHPYCVLLLVRFVQRPRGVRLHLQSHNSHSWCFQFEWLYRIRDRDSLCVVLILVMVGVNHLLPRVCVGELGESADPVTRLFGTNSRTCARPAQSTVQPHAPTSKQSLKGGRRTRTSDDSCRHAVQRTIRA